MRSTIALFALTLSYLVLSGCGGPANVNTTNTATVNTNSPVDTVKKTPEPTTNNAPTLTPIFKAYCDAWVKNDEAALRKTYSQDTLKSFESDMKAEKIKSLLKFLEDDKVTGKLCEVRNETITGDSAVAEIRADSYPNGIKIVFVKENGEWKMTNRSPVIDAVKQTGTSETTKPLDEPASETGKPAEPSKGDKPPKKK